MRGEVRYAEYFCLIALSHVRSLSPFNGAICQNLTLSDTLTGRRHDMNSSRMYVLVQLRGETTSTKDEIQPKKIFPRCNLKPKSFQHPPQKAPCLWHSTVILLMFACFFFLFLFFFFFFPGRTRHTAIIISLSFPSPRLPLSLSVCSYQKINTLVKKAKVKGEEEKKLRGWCIYQSTNQSKVHSVCWPN